MTPTEVAEMNNLLNNPQPVTHEPLKLCRTLPEDPKRRPDLHRYTITGVLANTTPNGANSIRLGLRSLEEGFDARHDIWVPIEFVENTQVEANNLSTGEKYTDETGKQRTRGDKRAQYARAIGNSDGTAELQFLTTQAAETGRTLGTPPTPYTEFVGWLNESLTGVELLATRHENDNGFMEIKRLFGIDQLNNPKFIARMSKSYRIPATDA